MDAALCIYYLAVSPNFWHNFLADHLPYQVVSILIHPLGKVTIITYYMINRFIFLKHITYTCYSVAYYQFLLECNWLFGICLKRFNFFLKATFSSHISALSFVVEISIHCLFHFSFLFFVVLFVLMLSIFTNPSTRAGYNTRSILSGV